MELYIYNHCVLDRGLVKVSTCARDKRALQHLNLNVHDKHFDLDHDQLLCN